MRSPKDIPKLDQRKAIISHLNEACETMPEYSFAEILYSVFRKLKPSGEKIGWLRDITDKRMYSTIDNIIEDEKEEGNGE